MGGLASAFVIAEAGVNHNGDAARAHALVDAAAAAGADAVKFQSFFADDLVVRTAAKAAYQVERGPAGETHWEMLRALELDADTLASLARHSRTCGVVFLCTPFGPRNLDILERIGVAAYKVGSTDTANTPFLLQIARLGRPILLSTGMSSLDEVAAAVTAVRSAGPAPLALLHCTSEYPAPADQLNLRAIPAMASAFGVPVGYSDHTLGIDVAQWAVAAGACVIEKHLTLDRALPGPDHAASCEPAEFAAMIQAIRRVEAALGDGRKRVMPCEEANRAVARKGLVVARPLAAGETIDAGAVASKRPAAGLAPARLGDILGRRVVRALAVDEPLTSADILWD